MDLPMPGWQRTSEKHALIFCNNQNIKNSPENDFENIIAFTGSHYGKKNKSGNFEKQNTSYMSAKNKNSSERIKIFKKNNEKNNKNVNNANKNNYPSQWVELACNGNEWTGFEKCSSSYYHCYFENFSLYN